MLGPDRLDMVSYVVNRNAEALAQFQHAMVHFEARLDVLESYVREMRNGPGSENSGTAQQDQPAE